MIARKAVILRPGEGRAYPMGRISAVFKADGEETASRYPISEWWLEAHTKGPGPHSHPEDFENRSSVHAGALNISAPGNFEEMMPGIAQWFIENPPGHAA